MTKGNSSPTGSPPDEFEAWLNGRHRWIQTAARSIIDNKRLPTDAEIQQLTQLCKTEAAGGNGPFLPVESGSLAAAAVQPQLHLGGLSEVRGVNAIKPGASLPFGQEHITVIYGQNGSGKTGFSRVLKQACGSRAKEDVLANAFEDSAPPPSGRILATLDGASVEFDWSVEIGAIPQLRHVQTFDMLTATMYVDQKNAATYEPSRMRFVSGLIKTCDRVTAQLTSERQSLTAKLPAPPTELSATKSIEWLRKLSAKTTAQEITDACEYTAEMEAERLAIEGALGQKDIGARLIGISRDKAALGQIVVDISGWKDRLNDSAIEALVKARLAAVERRKTASEDAQKVFSEAPLEGVGQQSWMALWKQAEQYSIAHAYPDDPFPNTGTDSRCVLCQQSLGAEGKERLKHFQAFVMGGLEKNAKLAEEHFAALVTKHPKIPSGADWLVQAGAIGMDSDLASSYLAALSLRATAALTASGPKDVTTFDWNAFDAHVAKKTTSLDDEEKSLKALQNDEKRKELSATLLGLRARQWLSQNKAAVAEESKRLAELAAIAKAMDLAGTAGLTKKTNEIAKNELDAGYQLRFASELEALGGKRLPVAPESTQAGKGNVAFGLELKDAKKKTAANNILSEGELRVIALAAFIADMTGSGQPAPFIFDDPISSLDQDFEERVVTRLVELAKSRQVIVFTHRLSLVTLIGDAVKKLEEQAKLQKTPPQVSLEVKTLRRMGKQAGIVAPVSVRDANPVKALNDLRNNALKSLRKLWDDGNVDAYDAEAKGVCSDFRILLERSIETIMLAEVVLRFRRGVQTQGRLAKLAKINTNDCSLFDELMTRYSVFEHSQTDELPSKAPDIDELESDAGRLAVWLEEFGKRPVV